MGKRLAIVIGVAAACVMVLGPSTASATFPGKNGPIAFTALHDLGGQCPGGYNPAQTAADEGIFAMNPDGSDASQVSSQHRPLGCEYEIPYYSDSDPSYSSSGRRFVFTSAHHAYPNDGDSLVPYPYVAVMDADGTNRRVLAGFFSSDPSFSPSGKKIVFVDRNKVAVMSSRGKHERRLTGHGENGYGETGFAPAFYPSGARIAYVSYDRGRGRKGPSIATIRLDGSHRRRLTKGSASSLDVSPNGKQIVFGRGRGIYVIRSDGTHKHRLADGSDPVFSPNGRRIAFTRLTGTSSEIVVMRADGSDQHAVIPNPLPFGVTEPSDLDLADPSWGPKP